jgi:hypothetical protein
VRETKSHRVEGHIGHASQRTPRRAFETSAEKVASKIAAFAWPFLDQIEEQYRRDPARRAQRDESHVPEKIVPNGTRGKVVGIEE